MLAALSGASCSSGFHCQKGEALSPVVNAHGAQSPDAAPSAPDDGACDADGLLAANQDNTIFAHPGMLFLFDWGGGRAEDATQVLVDRGCGKQFLLVTDRSAEPLYQRLVQEKGTSYLGLHYSLGATPHVVAAALRATAKASQDTNRRIVYNAILVEPQAFEKFDREVDLSSPHLGMVIAIVSSEYSFLRPNMRRLPRSLYENEKVIIIYAEDFHASWGHFGFLGSVRSAGALRAAQQEQARNVFVDIARDIVDGKAPACIRAHIEALKTSRGAPEARRQASGDGDDDATPRNKNTAAGSGHEPIPVAAKDVSAGDQPPR